MTNETDNASLIEHLQELRNRFIWVIGVFLVSLIIGFFITNKIFEFLKSEPTAIAITLNVFSPSDGIGIWMKFSFTIALFISLPYSLYQLWAYVRPGLLSHERRATIRYIPYAIAMFIFGLLFAYYLVFPMAFYFTLNITRQMGLQETYGIAQYFSFMINILLPVALLFELPIIVMFLTRIKLINAKVLKKLRKLAYLILITAAAALTPPDIISDVLVAVPLILLFEISVYLSNRIYQNNI